MTISIKSIGGTINEQPKVTDLKTRNFETETIEVEYKVEDVELTICRHYITVKTGSFFIKNRTEITKDVGYESDTNIFVYKIGGLQRGETYTIQVFASDGLDEGASDAIQQSTKNTSVVGFTINDEIANSDDSERVKYIEEAVGVAPMTTSGMGGWKNRFPFDDFKIVGIKNGVETGLINKNNKKQYLDGSPVPADVDVYLRIPRIYWKVTKSGKITTVKIANYNATGDMVTLAHNKSGGVAENNYIAIYQASEENGRLRSKSGATVSKYAIGLTSGNNENNSTNVLPVRKKADSVYHSTLFTGSGFILMQLLFVLAFKSTDSDKFLGASTVTTTGTADTKGFISKASSGVASSFLGIENVFDQNQYLDGISMVWNDQAYYETGWAYCMKEDNTPSLTNFYNGYKTKAGLTYLQGDSGAVRECVGNNYCGLLAYATGYPATNTTYYKSTSRIDQGNPGTGFRGYNLFFTNGKTLFGIHLRPNCSTSVVRLNYRR